MTIADKPRPLKIIIIIIIKGTIIIYLIEKYVK